MRRSKSQHFSAHKGGSFVTSIQHGGSVTLVSLGGDNSSGGGARSDQVGNMLDTQKNFLARCIIILSVNLSF